MQEIFHDFKKKNKHFINQRKVLFCVQRIRSRDIRDRILYKKAFKKSIF